MGREGNFLRRFLETKVNRKQEERKERIDQDLPIRLRVCYYLYRPRTAHLHHARFAHGRRLRATSFDQAGARDAQESKLGGEHFAGSSKSG